VGPWDSSREAPAASTSQMLPSGWSIHRLRGPSASFSCRGICGMEYLAFLHGLWREKAWWRSWEVVPTRLGEKNHPQGVEEVLVPSRPPLPLRGQRGRAPQEHAGSGAVCVPHAGPAAQCCPIPLVTAPPPLPARTPFCCCSRPLPTASFLPGSSSQAGQHPSKQVTPLVCTRSEDVGVVP